MSGYADLAALVRFRPLSTPLPAPTYTRWGSPFSASWSSTVELLAREVKHLRPRDALLEVDIREQDFRIDGLPRANARQLSPGVILSLVGTPHGDLRYACHRFRSWEDNVRALALSLEALRKVDRYGVTKRGEQYAGWKALTAGAEQPSATRGQRLVEEHGGIKKALHATHPDHHGDPVDLQSVQLYREQEETR